jgi:hypothetical protein
MSELLTARLACGCRLAFKSGSPGSPVTVVVERKAETCTLAIHVGGMAIYDHRSALRPSTRVNPPLQPDYEDG